MSRIDQRFHELKKEKRKGVILFVTAGDPDLATTEKLIPKLMNAGADILEIGVPFSDPLADGPTIQESYVRALSNGVTLKKILAMIKRVRGKVNKPILLMSAYNIILQYGLKKFAKDAEKAGLDGLILPDLIPEEAGELLSPLLKTDIDPVFLTAPTSTDGRIELITKVSKGFIYAITVSGITGKQKPNFRNLGKQVSKIRKHTELPIACGFGISTPADAHTVSRFADAIIIGSALVKILGKKGTKSAKVKKAEEFVKKVRRAVDKK